MYPLAKLMELRTLAPGKPTDERGLCASFIHTCFDNLVVTNTVHFIDVDHSDFVINL